LPPDALLAQCDERRQRRGGPGGQHRNKVETGVVLRHEPTGIEGAAFERRGQAENRRVALRRLRVNLAVEVRTGVAVEAPPSRTWQSRLRGGRLELSPKHDDFPVCLAEALDRISSAEDDIRAAADALGCTSSQLVKLLAHEPRALQAVNDRRAERGLRPLR
jgi:hypothetical protein